MTFFCSVAEKGPRDICWKNSEEIKLKGISDTWIGPAGPPGGEGGGASYTQYTPFFSLPTHRMLPRSFPFSFFIKFIFLFCPRKNSFFPSLFFGDLCTDKKENKSFLIHKEIQKDRVQSHI